MQDMSVSIRDSSWVPNLLTFVYQADRAMCELEWDMGIWHGDESTVTPLQDAKTRNKMCQSSPGIVLMFWLYFAWFCSAWITFSPTPSPPLLPIFRIPCLHTFWAMISLVSVISRQRDISCFSVSTEWNVAPVPSSSRAWGNSAQYVLVLKLLHRKIKALFPIV